MTVPAAIVTPLTPSAAGREAASGARAPSAIERLTVAMARGDETAFREFHDVYFQRLLRYLFVVARGDEEAARDALQETFARVARRVRKFESEDVFWSWLTLLARNAAIDAARQRQRYGKLLARFAFFWSAPETSVNEIDAGQLDRWLDEAIGLLEPLDRTLIEQKYFQQATARELAARLQLTERAVESRLARARRTLRAALTKRLNDETKS
jgi:RNA polymerase sigma factor (sigma-70 family)